MKKTSDRVLDIMYRLMDFLIVIAIIIVIILVLSSRLNPMLGEKKPDLAETKVEEKSETPPPSALDNQNNEDNKETVPENNEVNANAVVNNAENPDNSNAFKNPETPETNASNKETILKIPDVATSFEIGQIVANAGYCKDAKEFANKAVELKLDTRLIPGEYKIPAGATLEDVIKIIARKK